MYRLKGFLAFGPLTNNTVGVTSPIGELSTDSLTYARETGLYTRTQYPDVSLYSFFSADDTHPKLVVPDGHVETILNYAQTLFYQSQSGTLNSHTEHSLDYFKRRFVDEFYTIEFGEMRTNGNQWLPETLIYRPINDDALITLWLSDEAFSYQYDEYEYALIPPVENIDVFHSNRLSVEQALRSRTLQSVFEDIELVKERDPFTVLESVAYTWMNPDQTGDQLETHWTLLIYGRYGQNIDRIRQFVADWILERSQYEEDDWAIVFPDIFNPTEFILLPLWHQYAIPNQTVRGGFHSPMTALDDAFLIATHLTRGHGYQEDYLKKNTVVTVGPDRSLMFFAVGSEYNYANQTDFRTVQTDYVGFSPTSMDFGRLSESTQHWIHEYIDLLIVAETMTETSFVPKGYGRVIRDRRVYALRIINDMTYLMITKGSAIEHLGIKAPYDPEFDDEDDDYCNVGARIIREHLLYEHNAHNVTREQVDLDLHTGDALLSGQQALDATLQLFDAISHAIDYSNVHGVTPLQIGLGYVDNRPLLTTKDVLVMATLELNSIQ